MATFKEFKEVMEANPELAAKYMAAQKTLAENKAAASKAELMSKAAAEVGYELSIEEAERAIAGSQQLNEEELADISAGGDDNSCAISYGCNYFFVCDTTVTVLEVIDELL